ncbi:MAG: hypothetical protein ACRD96_05795, partial [Bryobacteraceae bacterium]
FSFGAVLYQMLTGRRAFEGDSSAGILVAVLTRDPAGLSEIAPATPPAVDRLVRKCLAKRPDDRWQSARDLAGELEWIGQAPAPAPVAARAAPRWIWAVLAASLLVAALAAVFRPGPAADAARPVQFLVYPPHGSEFSFGPASVPTPEIAVSPDGRYLAFCANDAGGVAQLLVRAIDQANPRSLAGTDKAYMPFWSPDSRSIGFFAGGKLKRVDVEGGPVRTLCDAATDVRGGTWNVRGDILFAQLNSGILRVSASGGQPQPATELDVRAGEFTHYFPQFLPDGRHILYMIRSSQPARRGLFVGSLDGPKEGKRKILDTFDRAAFAPPRHLIYFDGALLLARGFDPERLELVGEPVTLSQNASAATSGYLPATASANGVLAYA